MFTSRAIRKWFYRPLLYLNTVYLISKMKRQQLPYGVITLILSDYEVKLLDKRGSQSVLVYIKHHKVADSQKVSYLKANKALRRGIYHSKHQLWN